MNQWEYDTILMVLNDGVPALAERLCNSLQDLVAERNQLSKENEELKSKKCDCECEKPDSEEPEAEKAVKKTTTKKTN